MGRKKELYWIFSRLHTTSCYFIIIVNDELTIFHTLVDLT